MLYVGETAICQYLLAVLYVQYITQYSTYSTGSRGGVEYWTVRTVQYTTLVYCYLHTHTHTHTHTRRRLAEFVVRRSI